MGAGGVDEGAGAAEEEARREREAQELGFSNYAELVESRIANMERKARESGYASSEEMRTARVAWLKETGAWDYEVFTSDPDVLPPRGWKPGDAAPAARLRELRDERIAAGVDAEAATREALTLVGRMKTEAS